MTARRRRVALYTMGCKTNQYDSSRLAEEFAACGFEVVPFSEAADVYVVNSCTVTGEAEREAVRASRRALARNPRALVVATGCCPQVNPAPFQRVPGIWLVGGNELKRGLAGRVRERLDSSALGAPGQDAPSLDAAAERRPGAGPLAPGARTRRVVKVQEGCNYRCAYCVVPYARGQARSRPLAEVLEEVRRCAGEGYREVVLTGTCLGSYGRDLCPPVTLADCAAAVAAVPGVERLRLSSIEPWELEPDLVALAARNPVVCPHFHLPLQSGDDGVRRRMRRPGSGAQFLDLVARLREAIPDVGITTDVIVGFPGETDAEFEATRDFCRHAGFSRMHVFRYSPRPFTAAARMPDQVPETGRQARSRALIQLAEEMAAAFAARQAGKVFPVLVEGPDGHTGLLEGLTPNYVRVRFPGDPKLRGEIVKVRALRAEGSVLLGRVEADE